VTPRRSQDPAGGQVIVLFALSLVVIMAVGALLFSGAQALVLRRQLQDGGDAAALAAVNLMPVVGDGTCTAARVASGGDLYEKAKASVKLNLGWTDADVTARMTVSCSTNPDYNNYAVQVDLSGTGPGFFGRGNLGVATTSLAINGQVLGSNYSVALLDPSNPSWTGHGSRTGCASYVINGGPTITYEGSINVDSSCTRSISANAAVKAANASFTMTMLSGATMRIVGEASLGTAARISPTPVEDTGEPLGDPLSTLRDPCTPSNGAACLLPNETTAMLPARNTNTSGQGAQCSGTKVACVLYPGTYTGGILAANGNTPTVMLLRPGIYYMAGGGFEDKGGAAEMIAIPSVTGSCNGFPVGSGGSCTDAQAIARYCNPTNNNNGSCQVNATTAGGLWQGTDCPPPPASSTCGVVIYNAKADNKTTWTIGGGNSDEFKMGSQSILLLRAYNPTLNDTPGSSTTSDLTTTFKSYKNLVVWQAKLPLPGASTPQPVIGMSGGACITLSGTVYASGAEVDFGGSSCGSGGGQDPQQTLQFVVWDLTLAGSNTFYFAYKENAFAKPFGYGLIQ